MKTVWRAIFSYILGMMVTRMMDRVFQPRVAAAQGKTTQKPGVDVDMKPCPVCGVYTALPCSNCNH